MKQKIKTIHFFGFVLMAINLVAQKDAQNIYEGNVLYKNGKFPESTKLYSSAIEANPNNKKANFNLGNSLYRNAELVRNGNIPMPAGSKMTPDSLSKLIYDQAAQNFAVVANSVSNKDTLHQAWHNIGNCYLRKKEFQQAVEAYKKSLKYNDKDEETRYNLAYALKNLPKDKKNGGGSNKQQPQNKKEEDKKDQQNNAKPQQNQMSKEQAEQLLKALMDSEKKLQDKRKQKAETSSNNVEKDW